MNLMTSKQIYKSIKSCGRVLAMITSLKRPFGRIFVFLFGIFMLSILLWSYSQLRFYMSFECSTEFLLTSISESFRTNGEMQLDDVLASPCWHGTHNSESLSKKLDESIRFLFQTCSKKRILKQKKYSGIPLVTLFTTWESRPDKYIVHNKTVMNWSELLPNVNLVLFTNDTELGAKVSRSGWTILPVYHAGSNGVPVFKTMFITAQKAFKSSFYAYANSDILFDNDLIKTLYMLENKLSLSEPVMITGRRTNVNIDLLWESSSKSFQYTAKEQGELFVCDAEDFFITSSHFPWDDIPDLVVGRAGYDNWIIAHALCSNFTVIDATKTILAVHQTTKYGNLEGFLNEDADYNRELLKNSGKPTYYKSGFTNCIGTITYTDYCGEKKIGKRRYIEDRCSCSNWT